MARIAGIDIPRDKHVVVSLTYIYGIGSSTAKTILKKCGMSEIYIVNPYECFLLMCLLTDCPLAVFADIWEMSYEDTDGETSEEKS